MNGSKEEFVSLLQDYVNDVSNEESERLLFSYLKDDNYNATLEQFIEEKLRSTDVNGPSIREDRLLEIKSSITVTSQRKAIPLWTKWFAAASILVVIGLGIYLRKGGSDNNRDQPAMVVGNIPAPTGTHAVITTSNGSLIYLDSVTNGQLAMEGNTRISKSGSGQINYDPENDTTKGNPGLIYNTLTNPRGSKVIQVSMSDGTLLWLNAGSAVTYPVQFTGKERRIQIEGEAYLEVHHDASRPFFVSNENMVVRVVGTHFNVNAYKDDDVTKVTLIEGRIQVSKDENSDKKQIVNPGQQALTYNGGQTITVSKANVQQAIAWKEGRFDFDNLSFKTAMKQIERWYNVDIVYTDKIPDIVFFGDMDRNTSLAGVIKLINAFGVSAQLEGRTVKIKTDK